MGDVKFDDENADDPGVVPAVLGYGDWSPYELPRLKWVSADNRGRLDLSSGISATGGKVYDESDDCVLDAWLRRMLVGGYGDGLERADSEYNDGAEARRDSWRRSSKVVNIDGSDTFEPSESNLSDSADDDCSWLQLPRSVRNFLESGDVGGEHSRLPGRDRMLLSVSAAEVPELDIRLVE